MKAYQDLLKAARLKRDITQEKYLGIRRADAALKEKIDALRAQRVLQNAQIDDGFGTSTIAVFQGHIKWMSWSQSQIQELTNARLEIRIALEDARQEAARAFGKVIALEEIIARQSA